MKTDWAKAAKGPSEARLKLNAALKEPGHLARKILGTTARDFRTIAPSSAPSSLAKPGIKLTLHPRPAAASQDIAARLRGAVIRVVARFGGLPMRKRRSE